MTQLNIEGRTVNVDDGFMKLSPEDQESTVQDIAKQLSIGQPTAGPKPSGDDVSALSAAQSLLGVGAYVPKAAGYLRHLTRGGTTAENQAQIEADIANYRQQHPIESTVGDVTIGSLPYAIAGEFAGPAKALGMTGRFLPAATRAAGTGALLGATDATMRGESPTMGAVKGALSGAGGVAFGKGAGMVYDAALRTFRPQAAVQRFLPNLQRYGIDVPASESQMMTASGANPATVVPVARAEEKFRKTGSDIAGTHDVNADQAMQQAHETFSSKLAATNQPPGPYRPYGATPPFQAGQAAVGDLVAQEQARAQAEVANMQAATGPAQTQLQQGFAPAGAPAAPVASALDAAQTVGQGIRTRQAAARQATTNAYDRAAQVPAGYNPLYLRNAGDTLLDAVNARPDVVRIDPDNTPAGYRAIQSIDRQIQAQLLNAARRGEQLGPMEMEQIRKSLVTQQQNAVAAARASGNYEDVRAIGRIRNAFDDWEQQIAATPGTLDARGNPVPGGLLYGDPAEIFATRQAARAAHAQERATYGRQGPGDVVGTFMGKVMGRFPGQELSPEGIVSNLMGTPDRPFNENSVPILRHLRDNVFGANSPEWTQVKQGLVDHLTGTLPGGDPIPIARQVQRIDRFLANDRQAGAILNPADRANLTAHANNLRAAIPAAPPRTGTIARDVATLAGRFGQPGTGQELIANLKGANGPQWAAELRQQLPADRYNELRQALFRDISEAPENMMPWGHQRAGQSIEKFLSTPIAHEMYDTNERAFMNAIAREHLNLVPPPGSTNPSGSAFMGEELLRGMTGQLIRRITGGIGGALGHFPGWLAGEAAGIPIAKAQAALAQRAARERAYQMFVGQRPLRAPVAAPQRIGAVAGRLLPSVRTGQTEQQ